MKNDAEVRGQRSEGSQYGVPSQWYSITCKVCGFNVEHSNEQEAERLFGAHLCEMRRLAADFLQKEATGEKWFECLEGCGFRWRKGQHGGHDCLGRVKCQRDEAVELLRNVRKTLEKRRVEVSPGRDLCIEAVDEFLHRRGQALSDTAEAGRAAEKNLTTEHTEDTEGVLR